MTTADWLCLAILLTATFADIVTTRMALKNGAQEVWGISPTVHRLLGLTGAALFRPAWVVLIAVGLLTLDQWLDFPAWPACAVVLAVAAWTARVAYKNHLNSKRN